MDKNLRDRVEKIVEDAFECTKLQPILKAFDMPQTAKEFLIGKEEATTALCSLIEEREDLAYANGWCASSDGKPLILKSQLKDQKGEK